MAGIVLASTLVAAVLTSCQCDPGQRGSNSAPVPVSTPEELPFLEWYAQQEFERLRQELDSVSGEGSGSVNVRSAAWAALGHWYRLHGYPDLAQVAYGNAEQLEPDSPRWLYYRGLAYADAGMDAEAEVVLRRSAELAPGFFLAKARLGELLLAGGDAAAAADWLSQARGLNPDSLRVIRALGEALIELGRSADGLALLEEAARRKPEDRRTRLLLDRARAALGHPAEASPPEQADAAERADAPPPASPEPEATVAEAAGESRSARFESARRLAWQGRHAEAVTELRRALGEGLGLREPDARLLLVYSLHRAGDRVGGLREELALLNRFPLYGNAVKGGVERKCGDAAPFIFEAHRQLPENPDVSFHLARILACGGQLQESRRELEALLDRWPEHEYAKLLLARLLTSTSTSARRDGDRALSLVEEVPQRDIVFNLESHAIVHAALGDFERAVEIQRKANIVADMNGSAHEWTKRRRWRYNRGLSADVVLDWEEGWF